MSHGWDPRAERSACGIGFVASASGAAERRIVELGVEALRRLEHRGADAGDGLTGDGAGVLLPIPHDLVGDDLGLSAGERSAGSLGVAMFFARAGAHRRLPGLLARACEPEGVEVVGWRPVPVDPSALGPAAAASAPRILQAILGPPRLGANERTVAHRIRRRLERAAAADRTDAYAVSLSFRTVTYKALARAGQLDRFYLDLQDERCRGWFAIFHQRYSTNTSPGWERAQPFRALCHNGEINTLSGNVARMRSRELAFGAGDTEVEELLRPSIDERGSDSSMLDETVDLLSSHAAPGTEPRDVRHAVAMVVPSAWHPGVADPEALAFVRWHEARMEPWDGPAALVFTDGRVVGAALDRNGLRPLRYAATDDGLVVCASETGVVDLGGGVRHGRLGPGDMIAVDPSAGGLELVPLGPLLRARPYGRWLEDERTRRIPLEDDAGPAELVRAQGAHGLTREELTLGLRTMVTTGREPTFSMGDDTPIPPLATTPRAVTAFLRQRFAQVTNPALDHLREGWVTSLRTLLGPRPPVLAEGPADHRLIELETFLLDGVPPGARLDATWDAAEGPEGLEPALRRLADGAEAAVRSGEGVLVPTHVAVNPSRAPVPGVLAIGAVHTALVERGLRQLTSIVAAVDDAFGSHDAACLLTCGADALFPRLALATVDALALEGRLPGVGSPAHARARYRNAVEEGVRKAMSRLGISVLDSFRGARQVDALGLASEVVERCFPGVVSALGGLGLRELGEQVLQRWRTAFEDAHAQLANPGVVKFRRGGEYHATNPDVVRALHRAVDPGLTRLRSTAAGADGVEPNGDHPGTVHLLRRAAAGPDADAFARFVQLVEARPPTSPRDLLRIAPADRPLPLDAVEGAEGIVARFSTAAISLGAISPEAHETLAVGANHVGARSNSGEGGEDPSRYGTEAVSRIKQVASARFGVTPAYLMSADELQIKIAQGSKPGEGGQLPAAKVTEGIAALRHAQPGIDLISPAPHHDIYSIEDLAQLVFDLRQLNPRADVSVKLVAESGVGTVAAGVAKALADVVHVAGADGGTGASPLVSIKHAGLPWELGLAETRLRLGEEGIRDRVRLRVDGGFRIGRDVVVAAMLGADEFSFGTAALLAEGCLMVRTCHLDTCPVGIATQRPELRARFAGTPEMVSGYLTLVAGDVRRILASVGLRSLGEAVGRTDLLRADRDDRGGLDVSRLLGPGTGVRSGGTRPHPPRSVLGDRLAAEAAPAVLAGERLDLAYRVTNRDRAVGARLGGAVVAALGDAPPPGRVHVSLSGDAGQSLGAFLTAGVELRLEGTANDGVGKGMAGGRITIRPPAGAHEHPVLLGNAALYGATGGELFVAGAAGERFAVRNSGATAVVEGVGANGCEYMTGGVVAILGPVGPNLAAGMTGGLAYVFDPLDELARFLNPDLVDAEGIVPGAAHELVDLLERHVRHTGSAAASAVLASWGRAASAFRRVVPRQAASAARVYEMETSRISTGNTRAV